MSELKPCPFCGTMPKLQRDIRYPRPARQPKAAFEVVCQNSDCIIGFVDERYRLSKADAIKAWNNRAESEELKFTRDFIHEHGLDFALASAWKGRAEDGK